MEKRIKILLILSILSIFLLININSQTKVTSLKVNLTSAFIKDSPSSFGKTLLQVDKGTSLLIIEINDPWYKVKANGNVVGWINKTAFTDKKVLVSFKGEVKSDVTTTTAATRSISRIVALFNSKLYNSYILSKNKLNINALDEIEKNQINLDPVSKYSDFRKEGKLGEFM